MKKIFKIFKKKWVIMTVIVVLVAAVVSYFAFFRNGNGQHKTVRVSFGTVVKEVSETGAVKVSEKINLSPKYAGRIDKILVGVGDNVLAGQDLAKMDTDQLYIELTQAQAALDIAKADYDKLLAGSTPEEIRVAEADVFNSQVSLDNAEQSLLDIKADAQEDLDQAYQDAVDELDDAYLKLSNAYIDIDSIQRTYFTSSDQESINFRENKNILKSGADNSKEAIDEAKLNYNQVKIDSALAIVKEALSNAKQALEEIRNIVESVSYRDIVPVASKTTIDNHKTYINTAYTNIVGAIQTISATKITNEKNINTAKASVDLAEAALNKSKEQLALKKASPTQENVNLYLAKVKQAQAQVYLSQNKIQESIIKSPAEGQVTDIYKRQGEVVQSSESVLGFLARGPFKVEADIYEEDIVYVNLNDSVRITLPAFPSQDFTGRVILIDPAEKIIDGVVYYQVDIIFNDVKEGIKPGMTADIVIEAEKKENVLVIPRGAMKKRDSERIVKVFSGKNIVEKQIKTGLEGDDVVEVISGLKEGDQVVID